MPTLLLITPENKEINNFRNTQFNNFTQLTMPYLAGFVPVNYEIKLVDEYNEPIPLQKFDLVGITVNTPNALHVYDMARKFRELGAWVVLGGPHVTLLPEEAARHADTIFIGEAEEEWPVFLNDFLQGKPQNTYRCKKAPSLQGLPLPRRDLISGHKYTSGSVFSTRGCPHNCSYCCLKKIYCSEFRTRPIKEVIEDIQNIPNKHFVFWDDNFFADPAYAKELLKTLASLNKKWAAQVTAHSCCDGELLSLARKAGCKYLFLGLESFTTQGLQNANKQFNQIDKYEAIVNKLHKHGISVQAGIVVGFDADKIETFAKTLGFCEFLGIDGATVSILTPFPGTDIYEKFKSEGRLLDVDWSYYNGKTRVAYQPKHMTPEELLKAYNNFRKNFYSWRSIVRRLLKSKVNTIYNLAINLGYRNAYYHFQKKNSQH